MLLRLPRDRYIRHLLTLRQDIFSPDYVGQYHTCDCTESILAIPSILGKTKTNNIKDFCYFVLRAVTNLILHYFFAFRKLRFADVENDYHLAHAFKSGYFLEHFKFRRPFQANTSGVFIKFSKICLIFSSAVM